MTTAQGTREISESQYQSFLKGQRRNERASLRSEAMAEANKRLRLMYPDQHKVFYEEEKGSRGYYGN